MRVMCVLKYVVLVLLTWGFLTPQRLLLAEWDSRRDAAPQRQKPPHEDAGRRQNHTPGHHARYIQ